MGDHRRLAVWQASYGLTLAVYRCSAGFPPNERFGLTAQLRRAAVSVSANLAEGAGRLGDREFARFVCIARGSTKEAEFLLQLAHDLGYIETEVWKRLGNEARKVSRMLSGLHRTLTGRRPSGMRRHDIDST